MGVNYGPHVFFQGFQRSNTYGTSLNKNQGGGHSKGRSKTRGGGRNRGTTTGSGHSTARGSSWSTSQTKTKTEATGKTKGYQIGGGVAESFHKKTLLDNHEMNSLLRSIPDDECDHPAFPGMMLVRIAGEDATFVRRSNYDQDPLFERCFSEDPAHKFLPLNQQPLLGFEYTPAHVVQLGMPELLHKDGYVASAHVRAQQKINAGDILYSYGPKDCPMINVTAPFSGRVLAVADDEEYADRGSIVTVKATVPSTDDDVLTLNKAVFGRAVQCVKTRIEKEQREKARAEQAQREAVKTANLQAWNAYDCWHDEKLSHNAQLMRRLKLIGGPAIIGAFALPVALLMLFNAFGSSMEDFPLWAMILGAIGGAKKGWSEYTNTTCAIQTEVRSRFSQITRAHGPRHV